MYFNFLWATRYEAELFGLATLNEVEIEMQDGCLVIRPVGRSRVGWEEAFAVMAAEQDDVLLDPPTETSWDEAEWEW